MACELSQSGEIDYNVTENLIDLDYDTLCVILAEWHSLMAQESQPDYDSNYWDGDYFDNEVYESEYNRLKTAKYIDNESLAYSITEYALDWQHGRTSDNGGFNAWVCPYGCHTVSCDREE